MAEENGLHWLVPTLIGVILGAVFPYLIKFAFSVYRRFRPFFLEGLWYSYYFIYQDGVPTIKHETWNVKKGILNKFVVKADDLQSEATTFRLRYRGTLSKEQNLFTVILKPETHKEEILIRFKGTYDYGQKILLGLWSGIDLDGYACVGPQIISRTELSDEEIVDAVRKVEVESEKKLMKIS